MKKLPGHKSLLHKAFQRVWSLIKITWRSVEVLVLLMLLANMWVISTTNGRTFSKVTELPSEKYALVLGTSPKMKSGVANPYFVKRMEAASTLYHMKKVEGILVSGEKSPNYDEPEAMKQYLMRSEGVPASAIIKDSRGFNTQASISRCKDVFGIRDVIIVSQGFHNTRALFIARNLEMNAYAFEAKDVDTNESFYRNHIREILARVKAVVLYLVDSSIASMADAEPSEQF